MLTGTVGEGFTCPHPADTVIGPGCTTNDG